MRRWTGPVTMLVLFSFLAVGPITHTPRAEADCGSAGCAAPVACNTHAGACWKPTTNARWQYQLQAARDKSGNCLYTSTGGINVNISATPFTRGASVKPSALDIDFQTDRACTGLTITGDTQLLFNTALANLAHSKGFTVALKNDVEQVPDLAPYFDYAINEQCEQYSECGNYTTYFVNAGKAVFQVEYKLKTSTFCPPANAANRNAILKTFDLFDLPWTPCR